MLTLISSIVLLCAVFAVEGLNPVILVNGYEGAQLTATLDNLPSSVNPYHLCQTNGTLNIWVNPMYYLPGYNDCLNYYTGVEYSASFNAYYDMPYVTINTFPEFGSVDGLAYLSLDKSDGGYYNVMIDSLSKNLGYVADKDLHAATYDWRLATDGLKQRGYFKNVQKLVEKTYTANGNASVVFISHSMGGPVTLDFLNQMSQEWKNKYISKFIALAPAFGGSMESAKGVLTNGVFGGGPAVMYLLPRLGVWEADEVLISTPLRNYTAADWDQLFVDIGNPVGHDTFSAVTHLNLDSFPAPNVNTHVLYGTGTKTIYSLSYTEPVYERNIPLTISGINYEDGDDTISTRSATRGRVWGTDHASNGFVLEHIEFKGVDHVNFPKNEGAIRYVLALLTEKDQKSPVVMEA